MCGFIAPVQSQTMQNLLKPSVNTLKLEKRLRRNVGKAIQDFNMIEAG